MAYILADLKSQLDALPPNGYVGLHYDDYSELFPPGEPDVTARRAAEVFARSNGCEILNRPADQIVDFVKKKITS